MKLQKITGVGMGVLGGLAKGAREASTEARKIYKMEVNRKQDRLNALETFGFDECNQQELNEFHDCLMDVLEDAVGKKEAKKLAPVIEGPIKALLRKQTHK